LTEERSLHKAQFFEVGQKKQGKIRPHPQIRTVTKSPTRLKSTGLASHSLKSKQWLGAKLPTQSPTRKWNPETAQQSKKPEVLPGSVVYGRRFGLLFVSS